MREYVSIELFAGVGGMSLGFSNAGFRLLAAVEKDPVHASTHAINFPACTTIIDDVSRLSGRDIRDIAGLGRSADLHVLFGGPPCQGFSIGGKRNPDDPRNGGVLEFARLVAELKPLYFVLENVHGFLGINASETIGMFLDSIARHGYDVASPIQSLEAADYSVPQWRRRAFVLGYRNGCVPPRYPSPSSTKVVVSEAIGDFPRLSNFAALYRADAITAPLGAASKYAAALRYPKSPPERYPLTACLLTRHADEVRRRFGATMPGQQDPISRFFRLDSFQQATTLRAGTDISRGRFTAPRPIHPVEPRCITVREAARLHSFPDWFRFHSTIWHGFRQVGNAVPPNLAWAVARQIRRALAGDERDDGFETGQMSDCPAVSAMSLPSGL
jgi:DNA (cytosine-5)-methyltransferase 1